MNHGVKTLSIGFLDGFITLGFLGLMATSIRWLMKRLPGPVHAATGERV
jgi:hypothetical protein